ncbi:hypothetical protein UFOVP641_25 [uncultured Caudovirales phage]|uniref:Uncharacterized protein n=1 Tax=uncultured Caudovirales phage TaxID=2100421 RepID=A0A6J5N8H7_9CAUD|nr:hypothetical protein UFOVP641_25 [uncultured Caudovirales phage]
MDKEQLRQFLEQVAQIEDMNDYGPTGRKRGPTAQKVRFITRIEIDDDGDEIEIKEEIPKHDPYIGIVIKRLKPKERACELSCGRLVEDQVIEKRLILEPFKHYRTRCSNCSRYLSPRNGTMVSSMEIGREFVVWKNNQDK